MPINPESLTDVELAACADAYIRRTVNRVRGLGFSGYLYCSITAMIFESSKGEYEIGHALTLNQDYAKQQQYKLTGDNLLFACDRLVRRWQEDLGIQPTIVQPMLPAPTPADLDEPCPDGELEYTDFTEVPASTNNLNDDVPF